MIRPHYLVDAHHAPRHRSTLRTSALTTLTLLAITLCMLLMPAGDLYGQGRDPYVNFESPLTHPIEVFELAGHSYVAAVHTFSNRLVIFDTDETAASRLVASVPVGLEPVSVRFNATLSRLYTANFLGDSLSLVVVSAPSGPGSFSATMLKTVAIPGGDEPLDLAFYSHDADGNERETVLVTNMSNDGFAWLDAKTLLTVTSEEIQAASVAVTVDIGNGGPPIPIERAAKEPRAIQIRGDQLLILPLKGGEKITNQFLVPDMDLYCDDLTNPFAAPVMLGGLGTTGFNMAFDSAGTLYVVGAQALNQTLLTEPVVAAAPTGFVKSMFYRIENPCSGNATIEKRDVNLIRLINQLPGEPFPLSRAGSRAQTGGLPDPIPTIGPVKPAKALSMLTDLAVYEDGSPVPKVFFTALGNDRIGVIEPDPALANPIDWPLDRIDVAPIHGNPLAGPSGLAIKYPNPAMSNDPGARLYVLSHFDGSITTIDPDANKVVPNTALSLGHDPRPNYLVDGQRFLYDAKLSGNGMVSCASCHTYGRLDRLAWDLGTGAGSVPIPPLLPDGIADTEFDNAKGLRMTQSLQGLLNFEVDPEDQLFFTNAPYHWRGDRSTFLDFRAAFEDLLGGPELPEEEMELFEQFVNTIHYPPNPKQPRDRIASGDFGVGEDLASDNSTEAQRGMKIFHTVPLGVTLDKRACVSCHALPEGSNNRLTDSGAIETAAIRGLFQKVSRREIDGSSDTDDSPLTGSRALFDTGVRGIEDKLFNKVGSLNLFNELFFPGSVCQGQGPTCEDLKALNQFVHEVDWGTGPLIGYPATVDTFNVGQAYPTGSSQGCAAIGSDLASTLECMEQQAGQANSGIAVNGWLANQQAGYYYDPVRDLYVEEPPGTELDRTALLDLLQFRDRLLFQAVPLGSERRIAAPSGDPAPPVTGPAPSEVELLSMKAGTFYERIGELKGVHATLDNDVLQGIFMHTLRLLQWGLILDGASENGFGVGSELHNDPPRRFRVSAQDIRHGARLVLAFANEQGTGPPDPNLPLSQFANPGMVSLPLYPTDSIDPASDNPIWETAVELDSLATFDRMLGGQVAPGVLEAYQDQTPFTFPMDDSSLDKPSPGQFSPKLWNYVYTMVVNADVTTGDGGWQRVTVE